MLYRTFLLFFITVISLSSWSAPTVSLGDLLENSRNKHPDNRLFEQRGLQIQAMLTGEPYLPSPMLFYEKMSSSGMDAMNETKWEFRQKIPFLWKTYLTRNMYNEEINSVFSEWEQNQKERKARLTTEFFRWLAIKRKLKIKKDQEMLLTQMIAVQRTRYVSQKVSQVELVALQIERGNLLTEIAELEAEWKKQQVLVEEFAGPGISLKEAQPSDEPLKLQELGSWTTENLVELIEKNNSEVKANLAMVERGDLNVRQARAGWFPDLEIMLSERKDDAGSVKRGWEVGIEIPLWLANERRSQIGQAKAEAVLSQTRYLELKRKTLLEVESLLTEQKQLRRQLELMENGLVQWSNQNVQSARTAYQTGKLEYASFLALMQSAYQTLIDYEDLKVKVLENQEQLQLFIGGKS